MKFINTDGMAFIGPGSEWLWTMISGIVLSITFIAIFRQLHLQRNAGAIEQVASLNREWRSEEMCRYKLATLVALRDAADPAKLPYHLSDYFARVGYLVREGHLDRALVDLSLGWILADWWEWLAPSVGAWRVQDDFPSLYRDFEWLAGLIAETSRKEGWRTATHDDAYRARMLPQMIEQLRELIRMAEELRAVIVRPMSTATLTPDTAESPAAEPRATPGVRGHGRTDQDPTRGLRPERARSGNGKGRRSPESQT